MALILYHHPLASFCHKVLIALYEKSLEFEGRIVDLSDPSSRAELSSIWPVGKIPVLRDEERDQTIPETSIIIEYLDQNYPGTTPLIPDNPSSSLDARFWDRIYDLYVNAPVQKIVTDRLRPDGKRDLVGVEEARRTLREIYDFIEPHMDSRFWALGDIFTLADCAAAPALFYAEIVEPFSGSHPNLAAYFARLSVRSSFARALEEARPYFELFPFRDGMPARYRDTQP